MSEDWRCQEQIDELKQEVIEDIDAYLFYIKKIGQENCAGSVYWEERRKHWKGIKE